MTAAMASATVSLMAPHFWYPDQAAAVPALLLAAPAAFDTGGYFSRDRMCQDRVPIGHGFRESMQPALLARVSEWVGLAR